MKKEELKKLVEYKLFRMAAPTSRLIDLTRKYEMNEEIKKEEKEWFPKVEELESEFEILKKEVKEFLQKDVDSVEFLKNYKCNHQVRITNYDLRFMKSETCIFCGREFYNTNYKHCKQDIAMFIGKEITGYYEDEVEYITHYTEYKILKILLSICEISDRDDIDIVKELKKIKLDKCEIIRNNNKNFILFIVGSNKEKIDNYLYFSSSNDIYYESIINKFKELFNLHITIAGTEENLKKYKEDNSLELLSYDTIEDLEKLLKEDGDKYDLVIDMSNLFKVRVNEGKIIPERFKLDYKSYLPNSRIIKINDLSKDNRKKLIEYLNHNSDEIVYNRTINSWFEFYKCDKGLKDNKQDYPFEENRSIKGFSNMKFLDETKKLLIK